MQSMNSKCFGVVSGERRWRLSASEIGGLATQRLWLNGARSCFDSEGR